MKATTAGRGSGEDTKKPSMASRKRVNAENLATLGAERLADLLLAVAQNRPELKRQLRMELAANQGAEHLAPEIDKRLTSLETLTTKISWRQRPTFLRDLDVLRRLIAERMAILDPSAALDRMWRFMNVARRLDSRMKDKHGELDALFSRAAVDLGSLIQSAGNVHAAGALIDAISRNPRSWRSWLPLALKDAPNGLAAAALTSLKDLNHSEHLAVVRQLADITADVDAYAATFLGDVIRQPANAAEVANRLMAAGRLAEAGEVLEAAGAKIQSQWRDVAGKAAPDFVWETSCIEYLERTGQAEAAQAARWASFNATLSLERAKAFTSRLADFDDVEAENRAFGIASTHRDFERGLAFLMGWPAISEAGLMIEARPEDIKVSLENAEIWATKLSRLRPRAAYLLLRKAAADAFRRRELVVCDRLTQQAESLVASGA